MTVRLFYTIRRLIGYYSNTENEKRSISLMWKYCKPFSNVTIKRMLTVAHGTFCLVDIGDATIRGFVTGKGKFNFIDFAMRINIVGVCRFSVSLIGEAKVKIKVHSKKEEMNFITKEKVIVLDYINGLKILSDTYNDQYLLTFIDDFKKSDMYIEAFQKSISSAKKRNVTDTEILETKQEIDSYFNGGKQNG